MKKELMINYIWRAVQTFGKQGIFFLIFILSANILSQYEFGVYNYIMASIVVFTLLCDFGISQATARHIAINRETTEDSPEKVIFNMSVIVLISSFFFLVFIFLFGTNIFKENYGYILWAFPLIILIPLNSIQEGLYVGFEKFKKMSIIVITSGILSVVFSYFLINSYGLIGAILAQILYYLISITLLIIFHGKVSFVFKLNTVKNILKYSVWIGISGLGYLIFSRVDILILGYYGYIKEIANYEIVNKIFSLMIIPTYIFSSVMFPRISLLFGQNNKEKIWDLYKKTLLFTTVTSSFIIIIFYIFFEYIVKIFFGGYNIIDLKWIFLTLSVLFLTQMIAATVSGGFSVPTGHAKLNMKFLLISGILLVPIVLYSVINYGFRGVIVATVLVKLISDILYIYKYTKIIKWKK